MAYTRIHAIKSTVTKAVAYIGNPDKTEQQLLVDSFGCSPETARHDFDYAFSRTKQSDKNQAYHLIQSFAKGEVSHEEAHRIGIELADKLHRGQTPQKLQSRNHGSGYQRRISSLEPEQAERSLTHPEINSRTAPVCNTGHPSKTSRLPLPAMPPQIIFLSFKSRLTKRQPRQNLPVLSL